MGHAPPIVSSTALSRAKSAYVDGAITLEEFEQRAKYLVFNGLEGSVGPVAYEAPSKPSDIKRREIKLDY